MYTNKGLAIFVSTVFFIYAAGCGSDSLPAAPDAFVQLDTTSIDLQDKDQTLVDLQNKDQTSVDLQNKDQTSVDLQNKDQAIDSSDLALTDLELDQSIEHESGTDINIADATNKDSQTQDGSMPSDANGDNDIATQDGLISDLSQADADASICPSGYRYCAALSQCIPPSLCCVNSDCDFPRVCDTKGQCICTGVYSEPTGTPYKCDGTTEYTEGKAGTCSMWVNPKICFGACGKYRCLRQLVVRSADSVNCTKPDGSDWDIQTIGNTGYPDVYAEGWDDSTSTKNDDCNFVDFPNKAVGFYDMDITTNSDWKVRLYDEDGGGLATPDWMATFDDSYWRNLDPGLHKISTTNSSGGKLYELNITINAYK